MREKRSVSGFRVKNTLEINLLFGFGVGVWEGLGWSRYL